MEELEGARLMVDWKVASAFLLHLCRCTTASEQERAGDAKTLRMYTNSNFPLKEVKYVTIGVASGTQQQSTAAQQRSSAAAQR
jgi:hypothetical protein